MQQVEDTLNNSNELFLTFRKEMEEMSKKTKRLEKENLTLTRKHEQTNRNILEMAEERTRDKEDIERLRKQETQMRNIIKSMREQGRGGAIQQELVDEEGTESEYDEDYDDEDEVDEEQRRMDEEDAAIFEGMDPMPPPPALPITHGKAEPASKPVFGPVPPPRLTEVKPNGTKNAAIVNGLKH